MRVRVIGLVIVLALLALALAACGGQETPPPTQAVAVATSTPRATNTPQPTNTPVAMSTPAPTEAPQATEALAPTGGLVHFEDPAGRFSIDHLADFEQAEPPSSDLEGATYFAGPGQGTALVVLFQSVSEQGLSDLEWNLFTDVVGPALLENYNRSLGADFKELKKEKGEQGEHTIYVEGTSEEKGLHLASWLEESQGVLAVVAYVVPEGEWPERQTLVTQSLDSFTWSPQTVR